MKNKNMFNISVNLSGWPAAITGIVGIMSVCATLGYMTKAFSENGYALKRAKGTMLGPSDKIFPAAKNVVDFSESNESTDTIDDEEELQHDVA